MEPFALVLKPFQSYLTTNLKNINLIQILSNYVQKNHEGTWRDVNLKRYLASIIVSVLKKQSSFRSENSGLKFGLIF